jgi:NTP pyrophosphatase (non-canonical NTP hydrolase)
MTKENKDIVISHMVEKNYHFYNLLKAAEECQELATVLLQRVNKNKDKVPDSKIIEEIGDVKIRLKVLEKMFSKELIDERVNKKLNTFQGFIESEKYKNI